MERVVFLAVPQVAMAIGHWAWMSGSPKLCSKDLEPDCAGVYSGSVAVPGARCCGQVWVQPGAPHAYIFGGYGYDAVGQLGYLADLWEVNLASDPPAWKHIGGPSQANALGTADWPTARHYAAYGQDVAGGAFWIFSGQGVNDEYLPDLWRLDLKTMRWDFHGNFSQPAPRKWSTFWSSSGALYVLGGETPNEVNDLWELNYATGTWRLVYDFSDDLLGHYNGSDARPGSRHNAYATTAKDGSLWMYGGSGWGSSKRGVVSDVWRFDLKRESWSFKGGNPGDVEVEGTCSRRGITQPDALPTSRHAGYNFDTAVVHSRMLVYGGEHAGRKIVFDDLWSLNLDDAALWTFEAGDCNVANVPNATYGKRGVPALNNSPQNRYGGNAWIDSQGNAWIFGGGPNEGYINDLWRFTWDRTVDV